MQESPTISTNTLCTIPCNHIFTLISLFLLVVFFWPAESKAQAPRFPGCDVQTQIPEDECNALQIFFEKTNGLTWADRGGWMRAGQACEWKGVVCETGPWPRNVRKIILIDNDLTGNIPGELSFLSELEELVIETTATIGYFGVVEGFLPSALEDLTNLKVLRISGQEIRGPIPFEWENLESLEILDLSNNLLDGRIPEGLGNISSLKEIDLSSNDFLGSIPQSFVNLTNLEKLDLSSNKFSGSIPEMVGQLNALTLLNLKDNNLTGSIPSSMGSLTNLISLSIEGNNLDGPPPPSVITLANKLPICHMAQENPQFCIPKMPMYQTENLESMCEVPVQSSCSFCSSSQASGNSACSTLETLFYKTSGIDWTDQSGWLTAPDPCTWYGLNCTENEVRTLALPNNNLSGDIPEELGQLTNLTNLDLSGNGLTGPLPLSVALLQNTTDTCNISANDGSLCIPDDPSYADINPESICGLPIARSCSTIGGPGFFTTLEVNRAPGENELVWQATLQLQDARFEVERKEAGGFVVIGFVDAPDVPEAPDVYSFTLPELTNGIHTFRINMTTPDGPSLYSEEINVAVSTGSFLMEAPYPNPAQNSANLRFSIQESQEVTIALYDITGRKVREVYVGTPEADILESVEIPTQELASGVYFLRLSGTSFTKSKTLVIQK